MHGLPIAIDPTSDAFKKTVSGTHYPIYREDPGLLFTYVVRGDMVGMDLRSILMLNNSNIDFSDKTRIIFQLQDEWIRQKDFFNFMLLIPPVQQ